jgi:cytidyltransferase-like protein
MAALELLILATVAYTDQFDYPLSLQQIQERLVSSTALKSIGVVTQPLAEVTLGQLKKALQSLVKQKLLIHQGPWYGLQVDRGQFKTRRARAQVAKQRQGDWLELKKVLLRVPWILAVAITGSAAMANAATTADLDILVVAAPRRLWLARLITLGLSAWRRHHHQAGWCFNLWLEPAALSLEPARQGVYEAYELWQCRWLFDRDHWQKVWLQKNLWFKQFLPFLPVGTFRSQPQTTQETELASTLGDAVNYLAYQLQVRYRHWRYGEAIPPLDRAFLHQPGARSQIYRRWQASLAKVTSSQNISDSLWQLPSKIQKKLAQARSKNQPIVLVTGVFDILHAEHRKFLEKARAQGGFLLVGLETDQRVRELKGAGRPVNSAKIRQANLEKWQLADEIFMLPTQFNRPADHDNLIAQIQPAVLAVSSHTAHLDKKQAILQKYGGQVIVVHAHNPEMSTTVLLAKRQKGQI